MCKTHTIVPALGNDSVVFLTILNSCIIDDALRCFNESYMSFFINDLKTA
jgi:hypothetical protein